MNPRFWMLSLVLVSAAFGVAGCGEKPNLDAPKLILGQQECEECKMIVSEERFAAGVAFIADGDASKFVFDDVGCLVDWLGKSADRDSCIPYVHDYDTLAWLDARTAFFMHSEELRTPMASHIAAFADDAAAEALLQKYPGQRVTWPELTKK